MSNSRVPEMIGVLSLFLTLSLAFVLMRIYVKIRISKQWATDDTLLVLSQISFVVYCFVGSMAMRFGTGRLTKDVPLNDIHKAMFYFFLGEVFYNLTSLLIRYTIALFLLRICNQRKHKYIIYVVLSVVTIYAIFFFCLLMLQCRPTSFFWEQFAFNGAKGKCVSTMTLPNAGIAHSVISFVADWVMALLPIFILWDLQMNRRTKLGVGFLLSLGLLAGIATMVRIPYTLSIPLNINFLYTTADVALWTTIEPGLGLMAAGAVALRPLFKNLGLRISTNDSRMYRLGPSNNPNVHSRSGKLTSIASSKKQSLGSGLKNKMSLGSGAVRELGEARREERKPWSGAAYANLDANADVVEGKIKVDKTVTVSRVEMRREDIGYTTQIGDVERDVEKDADGDIRLEDYAGWVATSNSLGMKTTWYK